MSQYFSAAQLEHENISTLPGALCHYVQQRTPLVSSWLDSMANWPIFDRDLIAHPSTDCYTQPQTFKSIVSMVFADSTSPSLAASRQVYTFSPATFNDEEEEEDVPAKKETILAPIPINPLPAPLKRGRPSVSNARTARAASVGHKARSHHSNHREALNVEMENLRFALPFKKRKMPNGYGPEVKASKAAVLSGAVAHIFELERERDALRKENGFLKDRKR